ncbi:hypothetical protein SDC9_136545 [bioreactor metagenome]|uniref:Uncharacterized protein n=1 Tax=bioreactor metagenome TaxID=1076179 RepID=A0A645DJF1_9ZZZZ
MNAVLRCLQDQGRAQVASVVDVLKQDVDCLVLIGAQAAHVDVGFRAAIAIAPVVVHNPLAQRAIGSLLVRSDQGGVDRHASRIDVFREAVGGNLPRHFGDEFGIHRILGKLAFDD